MKIIKNYIIRKDKGSSGIVNTTLEMFRNGKGRSFRIFSDRPRMVINRHTEIAANQGFYSQGCKFYRDNPNKTLSNY